MPIPAELVSLIVDDVVECCSPKELSAALRSCCLVSRVWRAFSQPCLYSRFTRYKQEYWNTPLLQTLLGSERLQGYTSALWIDENWFIENGPERHLLFRLLPQLRTLGIWETGYARLVSSQSLERVAMSTKHLTALHLQSLDRFPVGLFEHWVALEELYINDTTLSGFLEPSESSRPSGKWVFRQFVRRPRPRLRLFQMEPHQFRNLNGLKRTECALDLSSLKTLHLGYQMSSMASRGYAENPLLREFTSVCASTIEDLLVQPEEEWVDAKSAQKFTQVRVLRFQFLGEDVPESCMIIPRMVAFLLALPNPEKLEELWLPALLCKQNPEDDEGVQRDIDYSILTSLLTSSRFENIQKIWIVYHNEHVKLSEEGVEQVFRRLLSEVYRGGRKRIRVRISEHGRFATQESEVWFYGSLD
ncbi:hypothetical protein BDN72DRAFT_964488 [Pluteus cervinus]|uniref:Uncharacterized protein n=1 Tax=Pluteus cervinus TaxID=181527 RepID=A0ACD3A9H8_9AGAR|nr:hypothetical protein BDN72DRAFT_964488 [Pluteus cervinus]